MPDIVDIAREAQRGMSAAVCACDKRMFAMAGVIGLVWNNIFGSMIPQTTFCRKLLITCRVINVISLYICIARYISCCDLFPVSTMLCTYLDCVYVM
jgi:hypothetical protein